MKYFDRHQYMPMKTLTEIGDIKRELWSVNGLKSFSPLENYLAGLYDGYNYQEKIVESSDMEILKQERPDLCDRIIKVLDEVNTYPEVKESELIH